MQYPDPLDSLNPQQRAAATHGTGEGAGDNRALLVIAGLLEILWAFTMKLSQGFTRPGASIVTLLAMLASFGLLSASMKTLPLGTAYTVWTGIGAVGAFAVGVVVLGESVNAARVLAAMLIVSGLILMKVSTA